MQSSSSLQPQPPTSQNLISILSHLLPPTYPLPPDLLSTPLKDRQLYFPPPRDRPMHDAFISLNPGSSGSSFSGSGSGSGLGSEDTLVDPSHANQTRSNGHAHNHKGQGEDEITRRLTLISQKLRDLQQASLDSVQGENLDPDAPGRWVRGLYGYGYDDEEKELEEGEVRGGDSKWIGYRRPDRETLLSRVDLRGLPVQEDHGSGEDHLEVVLLHEPRSQLQQQPPQPQTESSTDPTSDVNTQTAQEVSQSPWKLFDVQVVPKIITTSSSFSSNKAEPSWTSSLSDLFRGQNASQLVNPENEAEGQEEGMAAEDFWGGYDDDDDEKAGAASRGGQAEEGEGGDFWDGYDDDDNDDDKKTEVDEVIENPGSAKEAAAEVDLSTPTLASAPSFPQTQTLEPPETTKPASVPRMQTPNINQMTEDDPYWQHYASVEDGLRASNPPTPGGYEAYGGGYYGSGGRQSGYSGARTPGVGAGGKDYWGTGGETPVGWSPPVREAVLPNVSAESEQVEEGIIPLSSQQAPLLDRPSDSANIGTPATDLPASAPPATNLISDPTATANVNTTATPVDPARDQRQEHLRTALRALKGMYGGGEEEWDEVVREFASR